LLKLGLRPSLELLREVPVEEWEYWERTFINWYRALGWRVVNVTDGGEGLTNPSDETRAKCGQGFKGRQHTVEARAAIGAAFRGKPLSSEHRAKISAYRQREKATGKKRKLSAAHRAAIGNGQRGKRLSESQKERLRGNKYALGFRHTAKARAAISAASKLKKLSPAHIAALTEGRRKKKLTPIASSASVTMLP